MGAVIRAAGRNIDQRDVQAFEQVEKHIGFGKIRDDGVGRVCSKTECIGQAVVEIFRYARALFMTVSLFRIRPERNKVESAQANTNLEIRNKGPDALHNFPKETRSVLKGAAIGTVAGNGAQKFVSQISVAVLDVHKLVAQIRGHSGCLHVIVDNGSYLAVRHHGVLRTHAEFTVKNWMTVQNSGFHPALVRRPAEPSRVRELQPDQQIVRVASVQSVRRS